MPNKYDYDEKETCPICGCEAPESNIEAWVYWEDAWEKDMDCLWWHEKFLNTFNS